MLHRSKCHGHPERPRPRRGDVDRRRRRQTYEATFTTGPAVTLAGQNLTLCVTCNLIRRCSAGRVMIDLLGVVYDLSQGATTPLQDATVMCYAAQPAEAGGSANTYSQWPANLFSQVKPQTTGADGRFSFFTPPGTYQIQVNKPGFQPYRSWDIVVSNEPVTRDVPLTPIVAQTPNYTITIGPDGFEPTAELFTPTFAMVRAAGWVAHCLEQQRANHMLQPQTVYTGPLGRRWVPIDQRPAARP